MSKLRKVTYGFVIQTFDTELKLFVDQEFSTTDGDLVEYEDEVGNAVDEELFDGPDQSEFSQFEMVQLDPHSRQLLEARAELLGWELNYLGPDGYSLRRDDGKTIAIKHCGCVGNVKKVLDVIAQN